jgi:predicted DNA-binding transcriptional regulator YafY
VYRRWARTEGVTLEDPVTGAPIPVDIKSIDDVRYEWRATWDLSRIVFNPDEISAHLEGLRMADVRRDIQLMVIRLYFERRRLMAELTTSASDGPSPQRPATTRDKSRLRVLEIEAELDALSGGALSDRAQNDHR